VHCLHLLDRELRKPPAPSLVRYGVPAQFDVSQLTKFRGSCHLSLGMFTR
jgi:hypothetical protein